MRIAMGVGGEVTGTPVCPQDIVTDVMRAEAEISKQLSQLAELGVTEFWPVIFPIGDDPAASQQQTRALLAHLASA